MNRVKAIYRSWSIPCAGQSVYNPRHRALGPIRAAVLMAIIQTPHRFRTKRVLWKYSGFGVVTHTSADHRYVQGQLERSKKPALVRGLDPVHNHNLKDVFKGAAIQASTGKGPFRDFYDALVAKGMRPEMARLTVARKLAVITLTVWKSMPTPRLCRL